LCMVALVRAAPQLDLPFVPVALNQQVIVSDVVTALQPSIAQAVADALRSLSFSSGTFSSTTGSSQSSQVSGSSQFTGSSQVSGSAGISGSAGAVSGSAGVSGFAASVERDLVTVRPEYTFEWKVADDEEQTYINQNEARDGDDVTGSYSYIDANGDLITVNYQAGAMGYTQTMDKTVGAVQMRARPARVSVASNAAQTSAASGSTSSTGFASGSTSSTGSDSGFNSGSSSRFSSGSTSGAAFDSSALIAQIMRVLQPQIVIAVDSAVARL